MCFGSRKTEEAGDARSRELDRVIRQDEKRMAKEVKLLLLGAYCSGVPGPSPAPTSRSALVRWSPSSSNLSPFVQVPANRASLLFSSR